MTLQGALNIAHLCETDIGYRLQDLILKPSINVFIISMDIYSI